MFESAGQITVQLSTPAAANSFPCLQLFDTSTQQKLGALSRCEVPGQSNRMPGRSSSVLSIFLQRDSTIMPGDEIRLSGEHYVLRDIITPAAKFTNPSNKLLLEKCEPCYGVAVNVHGPEIVPDACDVSTATDVVFDGGSSKDAAGRTLQKYVWQQAGDNADVIISAAVTAANNANNGAGSAQLLLPAAMLSKIPAGVYQLKLTASDSLGASNHDDLTFTKIAAGAAPVVAVLSSTAELHSFTVSQGITLATQLLPSSVCSGKEVEWSWKAYNWPEFDILFPQGYSRKNLVVPGPVLGMSSRYMMPAAIVQMTARFKGSTDATTVNITLLPQSSPAVGILKGPSGDVRMDQTIVLHATSTFDPDDPTNAMSRWRMSSWECLRSDWPTPCYIGDSFGLQQGLSWIINGPDLTAGVEYTFTANLNKEGGAWARATLKMTPRQEAIPSGRLVRVCAAALCPSTHPGDAALPLSVVINPGSKGAVVSWSSDQIDNMGRFDGSLDISIPADRLPATGDVTVTASLKIGVLVGKVSITTSIDGAPSCSVPPCLDVTAISTVFPTAWYSVMPANFIDDNSLLRYDFGLVDANKNRRVIAVNPALPFSFTGLPVGRSTIFVCAVDAYGAKDCQQQDVTVTQPPTDFKVADALTSLDVSQLEGAGDISLMATGAQVLQSLSSYAGTNTDLQTAEETAQVQAAIAAKTSSMIGSLAKNVDQYIDDPNTMSQVVSTVATLTKATTLLSKDAKKKMANVGRAGIAAAKLSLVPISPEGGSRLLAVLAAANGVSAGCSQLGGCGQTEVQTKRLLLQAHERHLLDASATSNSTQVLTTTPISTTQQPYKLAYIEAALSVAELLLRGASPGSQWVSAGDAGVFVSVSTYAGRAYPSMRPALAAGPVLDASARRADAAVKDNVVISFTSSLTGTCTDDNGIAVTRDSCLVSTTGVYAPDPAATLESGYLDNADLPSGFQVMSGAVTLAVAGVSSGLLPCAASGCTANLQFPVTEPSPDARWLYQCFSIVAGKIDTDTAIASRPYTVINQTAVEAATFDCSVRQSGTYMVARYVNPEWHPDQGVNQIPDCDSCANMVEGQPVYVAFTFSMKGDFNYDAFFADQAQVNSFKTDLVTTLRSGLAQAGQFSMRLPEDAIQITSIYKGSIVVEMTIATTELDPYSHAALLKNIEDGASQLFTKDTAFMSKWQVDSVSARLLTPPAAQSNIPAIVGGVVGGVGGAAVVAGTTWYVLKRRRAAGVEPRNGGSLLAGDHEA